MREMGSTGIVSGSQWSGTTRRRHDLAPCAAGGVKSSPNRETGANEL